MIKYKKFISLIGFLCFFSCYQNELNKKKTNYVNTTDDKHLLILNLLKEIGKGYPIKISEFMAIIIKEEIKTYSELLRGESKIFDRFFKSQSKMIYLDKNLIFKTINDNLKAKSKFLKKNLIELKKTLALKSKLHDDSLKEELEKLVNLKNSQRNKFRNLLSDALDALKRELIDILKNEVYHGKDSQLKNMPTLLGNDRKKVIEAINEVSIDKNLNDNFIESIASNLADARLIITYNKESLRKEIEDLIKARKEVDTNHPDLSNYNTFLALIEEEGPDSIDGLVKNIRNLEKIIEVKKITILLINHIKEEIKKKEQAEATNDIFKKSHKLKKAFKNTEGIF